MIVGRLGLGGRFLRGIPTAIRKIDGHQAFIVPFSVLISKCYSNTPFPINHKEAQEKKKLEKMPKWRQWGIYFQSQEFKRSMTVYYLLGFGALLVCFYYYMRDRFYEDKQLKEIRLKYDEDPSKLSEYEYLMLKAFSSDRLKPKERKKFVLYQMMRKEFRRKNFFDYNAVFNPSPAELEEWYSKQAVRSTKRVPLNDEREEEERSTRNADNAHIVPGSDTTEFFEKKAEQYDREIKWEERAVFMGRRRRWLMKNLRGDVLEVSCGTGRNIPYLNLDNIDSITFLDSSSEMMNITRSKFRKAFPKYQKAAFTVGRAEELAELASRSSVKYDTIVEAFGLCAHQDPVKALQSMAKLLKPGGRIVLLEHGRSTWDFINNHLDFRAEKRMKTWACRWNLDIGELIDEAGLDITYEKRVHLGTTWLLVCKRPEDPISLEEKPFYNKLFGKDVPQIKKA